MNTHTQHVDDRRLHLLLTGDEHSDAFHETAAHVETCAACRNRLDALAGPAAFDAEARELLSDYPWEDLARSQCEVADGGPPPVELDILGPPSHPEMLGRLGRYEIERVIGSGGMGIVLKAFDTELNRPVAIKVLARHLSHHGAARTRFAREARAAAAVVHEHVVAIHNVEAEENVPFLVMHYVSGESLQARVDREGPLDAKQILRIAIQAAAGLAAAHEQGVVHRDVKPANILLENGLERVLITDFGLARTVDDASLTTTGVIAGTPHYMSPEQAGGEPIDHRTDLFSLGAVLYFMATGHPPFRADRAMGVLHRICRDKHRPAWQVNSDIPDELSDVIDRLLSKKPSRRYATAADVRDDLKRLLADMQQRRVRIRHVIVRLLRRHRVVAATSTAGALLTAAAVIAFLPGPPPADVSTPARQHEAADADPLPETVAPVVSVESVAPTGDPEPSHDPTGETSSVTGFQPDPGDPFWMQLRSLDERLRRLEDEPFQPLPPAQQETQE